MTYMDDRATRETMYRAYTTRATEGVHDNRGVLVRILELRREEGPSARLSRFRRPGARRADGEEQRASASVSFGKCTTVRRTLFEKENAELQAFRRELEGPDAPRTAAVGYRLLRREAARGALRVR